MSRCCLVQTQKQAKENLRTQFCLSYSKAEGKETAKGSKGKKAEETKSEGRKPAEQEEEKKEDPKKSKDKTE